ncbi:ferrochelatase [Mobiluncus mulieris]|uniref:Coproporphyrin III ferrochelatase n=1 Tax=Mobiluncus mulieris TaxID=2052 RepID=A0ABD4TVC1_9ACTO|nr:ferrochelatase [Mobiluncus mulieris]MCU9967890.1 ferrochelatase [Mobiluncus mulieris]MCU9973281.1 ferrochelatase [Mobiluncus mulieris]MCV0009601.1 ferrochelatase [Mobiluncus mulieris]
MYDVSPYDALMLVSYGGPNRPEDVLPFLRNATGGAGIPDSRLRQVGRHYELFGGRSPINRRNQELLAALRHRLGDNLIYGIGNRNWHPYFTETLEDLARRGARRILTLFTAAYTSYSGCRQYRENLAAALASFQEKHPEIELTLDRVRPFANTPGFVAANVAAVHEALAQLADSQSSPVGTVPPKTHLVYVTHSIPLEMARNSGGRVSEIDVVDENGGLSASRMAPREPEATPRDTKATRKPALFDDRPHPEGHSTPRHPELDPDTITGLAQVTKQQDCLGTGWTYLAQHLAIANAINRQLRAGGLQLPWSLAFCSRSGSPHQQWLEPDINDHLSDLQVSGIRNVVVAPIGFISDHMEVVFDLDTEAVQTAREVGLNYVRAATAESYPGFLDQLADLVAERAALARGEHPELIVEPGTYPALGENCGVDCCRYPRHLHG